MSSHIIINADDFGLSPGVCAGIIQAVQGGVVTCATAMICSTNAAELVAVHGPKLQGRLGLHLQLTAGQPCLPPENILSLVTERGAFHSRAEELGTVDTREVYREFQAQWQRMCDLGLPPTHLDCHHHVHRLPQVFPAYCRLALETGLPARGLGAAHTIALQQQGIPTADLFVGGWYNDNLSTWQLLELLERHLGALPEDGVLELMTHPGLVDATLLHKSGYTQQREQELQTLCDPELKAGLQRLGLRLMTPAQLGRGRGRA